ncbi:hypothetical protein MCAMS1_00892 [biofilm metagenome]
MSEFSDFIAKHNAYLHENYGNVASALVLQQSEPANEQALTELKARASIEIPPSLLEFYRKDGGVMPGRVAESRTIKIPSASNLLAAMNEDDQWSRLNSLGLIDYIKYSWGNDLWEFDEEISTQNVNVLNQNYHSFGLYRTTDGLESAYYLYFDKSGNFGTVFYHQDAFDELMEDYLLNMPDKSPASESLSQLLTRAFAEISAE